MISCPLCDRVFTGSHDGSRAEKHYLVFHLAVRHFDKDGEVRCECGKFIGESTGSSGIGISATVLAELHEHLEESGWCKHIALAAMGKAGE